MTREMVDRECPRCGESGVVSAREAERVYSSASDPNRLLAEHSASYVCTKCHALKV